MFLLRGFLLNVGFTMSLFVAGVAFEDEMLAAEAKIGILVASVIATTIGLILGFALTKQIGTARARSSG